MKAHTHIKNLIFALLFSNAFFAQDLLQVYNSKTDLPLGDVVVAYLDHSGKQEMAITSKNGYCQLLSMTYPVQVSLQHPAFKTLNDTLFEKGTYVFKLSPLQGELDEVVISGYLSEKRVSDAPREVIVISSEVIANTQARNLQEIMRVAPNLNVRADGTTGGSFAELLGIGGNNIKVLLDGVPLAGRTGQEFDISQVSLQNIERIEIIEGPMAVEYGSNAMAGVIHLISKKEKSDQAMISLDLSEETMHSEYSTTEGIHDHKMSAYLPISKNLQWDLGLGRRQWGDKQVISTGRLMDWDPRSQHMAFSNISFQKERLSILLNTSFLQDQLENDGAVTGVINPQAQDDEYLTKRFVNALTAKYALNKDVFQFRTSFNTYSRQKNTYINNFTGEPLLAIFDGAQDTSRIDALELRATWMRQISDKVQSTSGVEWRNEEAGGGRIAEGEALDREFSLFNASEFDLNFLTIRTGLRWSHSNRSGDALLPSLHLKKNLGKVTLRTGYAKGYRLPSLRELFFDFNDQNHRILGNPNLEPESSDYLFASATYRTGDELRSESSVRLYYSEFRDLIDFASSPTDPTIITLLNTESLKSKGIKIGQRLSTDKWDAMAQFNFISTQFAAEQNDWNNNVATSISLSYRFSDKLSASSNALIKGKNAQLINDITAGEDAVLVSIVDPYTLIDANVTYSIKKNLHITAGLRNLLNEQTVDATGGGVHGMEQKELIHYGRSAFLNIKWNFKINPHNKNEEL
ncbi:MAG: TonB-dependent receptor [Flavobacteriales bacterium]|nr:TonB-dependent receptor [Flavobacteriales bacterium]